MLSIANVGVNLSFPPQLVHHNCLGSVDTDVLSSGISLNRAICNGAHSGAVPLLIFPIYPKHLLQQVCETPIAVLHLEKRLGDSFTAVDETFCYSASNLIGEMLSRVNGMEWTDHFYDPVTQHIVAPFAPTKLAKLPKLATAGTKEADLLRKIEATAPEVLIRRDVLPASASGKSLIQGLSATPTLREVSVYLENMQNSWRKGITSTVDMTEEERSMAAELKVVRHQLKTTETQLTKANEQLRLYQLNTDDYKSEYGHLRNELTNYMSERDER
ncbi:hypothetical protein AGDE_11082 [Angomonas deanei]|nr:hypothetical protein AGDE_11082 [Angomonas deanei]|eukprot:EPY26806.1 hypothetical protein AGDE_11082 [Angomonas deanei]